MRIQDHESLESVADQALGRFDVDGLERFRRQRNRAGVGHVVGRLSRQQDRRDEDVGLLGNQLGALDAIEIVGADRQVQTVLLQRGHRDDHHVGSRQEIPDLRRRHVREVVPDLGLVPERALLGRSQALQQQQDKEQR